MADQTYRYRRDEPIDLTDLAEHIGGAVTVAAKAGGVVIDLVTDDTRKTNLDEEMDDLGFTFVETNPSTSAAEALLGVAPDGQVKISSDDTTYGYLEGKLVAGSNVTLTTLNPGGDETLEVAATGGGSGYPAEWDYASSEGESSTTSQEPSFVEKLKLTTAVLPAGTYLICWSYEWRLDRANRRWWGRVQIDDTTTIAEIEVKPNDSADWHPSSGRWAGALTAAAHEIDIDWCRDGNQGTAYIRRARLSIQRVA